MKTIHEAGRKIRDLLLPPMKFILALNLNKVNFKDRTFFEKKFAQMENAMDQCTVVISDTPLRDTEKEELVASCILVKNNLVRLFILIFRTVRGDLPLGVNEYITNCTPEKKSGIINNIRAVERLLDDLARKYNDHHFLDAAKLDGEVREQVMVMDNFL